MILVVKIEHFSLQNGDENEARRQKLVFSALKRRRERGSSSKISLFRLKTVTRTRLVAIKNSN
ncbi:hypothetical protein LIZ98_01470 [Caldibacillus sp. 210928-DFI.2.18]|uniref:hypothetical protein n=1 Tax=Caldibacillus sp. 210928-DFI.2.18 TaxID=2883264 RepID=UPI001D05F85F|nr:hypothetical protein [Caldibacillus sp. 210928-DFI.2.18]MCB7072091.1 hypothetical protein [Caldibacillus sp. 210928-DFI.2.18]